MLRIAFDRIGRNHNVADLTLPENLSAAGIADRVATYARRFLLSNEYEVEVGLADIPNLHGTVSLDGGRFGTGTITTTEQDTEQ